MICNGIVFDFNGTLVFDTQAHEAAWHTLIPELRGSRFSEDELKAHVHGRTNREIFSYVLGRPLSEEEAAPYGERKETLYREFLAKDTHACQLVPGAEVFFELLKREGIPMAIATAAPASNIAFYRHQFGLDRWFANERIIYADGTLPGKPHPALFLRAIERLDLPASECMIVEDSTLGIQAAKAAGAGRIIGIYANAAVKGVLQSMELFKVLPDFCALDLSVLE